MRKGIIRHFLVCIMVLLLAAALPVQVHAARGTIQILLKNLQVQNSSRNQISVEVYRVGDVKEDGMPVFDAAWQLGEYPQDGEALDAAAKKLADQIGGTPTYRGTTDMQGMISFENVEDGIYLIKIPSGNAYGEVKPFLVQLPYYEEVNGEMEGPVYQVEAQPKASPYQDKTPEIPGGKTPGTPGGKTPDSPVRTGDDLQMFYYMGAALAALLAILTVCVLRTRSEKNGRDKHEKME